MATPSQADCEKWFQNPLVNPLTKRAIQEGKPVWKKLEKDCEEYKSKPTSKPLPKPVPKSISPVVPKASPKLGRKLTKVRKGDCVGDDMIWKVGQGCFEVKKSSPKSSPKVIKPVEFIDTAALVGAEEWELVGHLKKDCKPIPPLRWSPGKAGKKGVCEKRKAYILTKSPKKVITKKVIAKRFGERPDVTLTEEEKKTGKYEMKETHFVRRVGGKIQKDCFEEGPIERDNIDIKKFSFDRKAAEANYINFNGPYPPEVKEWMNNNPDLLGEKVLSHAAYYFLQSYLGGSLMFKEEKHLLKDVVLKNLQQFRLDKPIRLFRGIHFGFRKFSMIEKFCALHMDPEKSYTFREDKPSSWTWNYTMAENFAKIGSFGFVITREFQPEEILIDLRLCKEYYLFLRGSKINLEDEVIVMPGAYKCEIVLPYPPGVKNGLAKPENLDALKEIKTFIKSFNARPYMGAGIFGADIEGLIGEMRVGTVYLIFDFDYDPKTKLPILYYGIQAPDESDIIKLGTKLSKIYNIKRFDSKFQTLSDKKVCPELDDQYKTNCYKVTTFNSKSEDLLNLVYFLKQLREDILTALK
jgi:hypothetical protein